MMENKHEEPYSDSSKIVRPKSLDELVEELHKIFAHEKVNVEYVQRLMELYESNKAEWERYAISDPSRYTRNLVDAGNGKFNLMLLCWGPSQISSIHSHANSHCFLKVLDGKVREELYDWPNESTENEMTKRAVSVYETPRCSYINDNLGLHRIENPSHSDTAVTLHLYSPPFGECDSFDQKTGNKQKVELQLWSKFGQLTPFGKNETS